MSAEEIISFIKKTLPILYADTAEDRFECHKQNPSFEIMMRVLRKIKICPFEEKILEHDFIVKFDDWRFLLDFSTFNKSQLKNELLTRYEFYVFNSQIFSLFSDERFIAPKNLKVEKNSQKIYDFLTSCNKKDQMYYSGLLLNQDDIKDQHFKISDLHDFYSQVLEPNSLLISCCGGLKLDYSVYSDKINLLRGKMSV